MPAGVVVAAGDLVIRRLRDDEADYLQLAHWRDLPHVRRFWDHDFPPATVESMRQEYQAETAPESISIPCIIELNGRPIGFTQFYRWASYAGEAIEVGIPFDDKTYGLDVFIGDPGRVGQGMGTRVVVMLSDYLVDELGASAVTLTTDVENHAAQRCYEKAGFVKVKQVLDLDTYMGERTPSWLMTKPGHST